MNQRPSVLLVDDAPDMLELLRRNVLAMGLVPYTAANVVDAIDLLGQGAVDLVITDLNMRGSEASSWCVTSPSTIREFPFWWSRAIPTYRMPCR
jgi:CheY-like chemotaxis protein